MLAKTRRKSITLDIPTAKVFTPLLAPARYKGAHGGRGSGKSHFFAENVCDQHLERAQRTVCIRENQKSLKESAKRLIEDKLNKLRLGARQGFRVWNEVVETPGDGIIMFQGMQDHTAESIKSLEGMNRAWVEEAQTLSARSLQMLRPTIRGEDSELWFSWNPRRRTDPVDMMFRKGKPPTNSVCVEANWMHNPWFPAVLEQERLDCLESEPEQYDHIWGGDYVTVVAGAYFAKVMAIAKQEGRIGKVTADPLLPTRIYCDIGGTGGKSDAFAMWAVQFVAREIRVLNYYEAIGQEVGTHLAWLRKNNYGPDEAQIVLPHDGGTNDRVFAVSYESAFRSAGFKVSVVPNQGRGAAAERIEAVRREFHKCYFNEKTTEAGRQALGWYHENIDADRNVGLGPLHDWASHGSDAFGLMCIDYKPPRIITPRSNRHDGKRYE